MQDDLMVEDQEAWPDLPLDLVTGPDGGRPDKTLPDTKCPYDISCTKSIIEAEDSTQVTATGWAVTSGSVLHGGQGLEAWSAGYTLSFSFQGTALDVFHETGPNRGIYEVSIDGGKAVSVDTYASAFNFQVQAIIAGGLAQKTHSALLTCKTAICALDYFQPATCASSPGG